MNHANVQPARSDAAASDTFTDAPQERIGGPCLPDLLRSQVNAAPDHIAVVCAGERLSYRQLAERSGQVARYLQHLGVRPDDCIGLFVEPSIETIVGAWAILLAGGAYLPLAPEYPEQRLRHMISEPPAKAVVTQEKLVPRLAELIAPDTRIVTLADAQTFATSLPRDDATEPRTGLEAHHLAYVIYTSGSTGQPKGVMIEHRSIVNQMRWLHSTQRIDRNRVILHKTPISFDAAQWEILAPAYGSTVVVGAPGIHRDPDQVIDAIAEHGVTTLQCVPTLLQALVDTERLAECSTLTQVFCGGDALSTTLAARFFDALPHGALVNLYGPTECTINTSSFTVDRATVAQGPATIPIGAPVHNTRYHILDGERKPLRTGEVGELYISGVQVGRGYVRRSDLTSASFIDNPFASDGHPTLYRTGDLGYWNADGTVQFVGRTDRQVKLHGFRVELDEIRLAIETHNWVKHAAAVVQADEHTGFSNLVAFIELNSKEAALMDQGNHSTHHQSKESKLQLKAQLSDGGLRDEAEISGKMVVDLPGRQETETQRRRVFARKTYRFFEGDAVTKSDILKLLDSSTSSTATCKVNQLTFAELGQILRYFGQFHSDQRLLPKYGYASPGALYATQMYLEVNGICGLRPGYYYYHPARHQLVCIEAKPASGDPHLRIHLVGKRRAIKPVYQNNIREVLEIEAGHMVGLFEQILPEYGLTITGHGYRPGVKAWLECADDDYYLGTFELVPYTTPQLDEPLEIYVQSHPGKVPDLPAGQYRYLGGDLRKVSDELIQKKHVIAINQEVYQRSSFGVALVSRTPTQWRSYLDLGRKLQHLQMNDLNIGLMSSGYSSRTGDDLPSARTLDRILRSCGEDPGPSYFFLGGRVSDEQVRSTGMKEDSVHMRGPAEMVRGDLCETLPAYMVPNKVVVLDRLPLTVNGKVDTKALEALDLATVDHTPRPPVAPRTTAEERIGRIWSQVLKQDVVSVLDDFFQSGGNSLLAVTLVNRVNRDFQVSLPLQVLFEASTIADLALRVDDAGAEWPSRLVRLRGGENGTPVFCWPGLGGYTMNLRPLASALSFERPFYGVQARGINEGERPYLTLREMAAADVALIRRLQPQGPYTLLGYSFGARVAFEAAHQIEQSGEQVENLFLIAPGSPIIPGADKPARRSGPSYRDRTYLSILFSVFAGSVTDPLLTECLEEVHDAAGFLSFITDRYADLTPGLVRRIARIVELSYRLDYTDQELRETTISAPITVFTAHGDSGSFIEHALGYLRSTPTVVELRADHYGLLKEPGVHELGRAIREFGRSTAEPTRR